MDRDAERDRRVERRLLPAVFAAARWPVARRPESGPLRWPRRYALRALRRVFRLVRPLAGGFRSTPARRALESPIAIACFRLLTPCFPRFTCSISSRTNSPAWVVAALPARLSRRARSIVVFSGMRPPPLPRGNLRTGGPARRRATQQSGGAGPNVGRRHARAREVRSP